MAGKQVFGGNVSTTPVAVGASNTELCIVGRGENIIMTPLMRNIADTCQNRKRLGNALKCVMNTLVSSDGSLLHGVSVHLIHISGNVQKVMGFSTETLPVPGDGQVDWRTILCVRNLKRNLHQSSSVI